MLLITTKGTESAGSTLSLSLSLSVMIGVIVRQFGVWSYMFVCKGGDGCAPYWSCLFMYKGGASCTPD